MLMILLRIVEMLIPIGIEISLMGYRNKTVIDYIKFIQLESHESHWLFKAICVQITIYVSLFFTMLVMCGILIKEQMPKKLIIIGSIVQVLLCIVSSYFLLQLHTDLGRYQFILCSSAMGFNGLLFTIDAIITFQQIIFSRPRS